MNKTEACVALLEKARMHGPEEAAATLVSTMKVLGRRTTALTREDLVLVGGLALALLVDDDSDEGALRTLDEWLGVVEDAVVGGKVLRPINGSKS